MEDDMFSVWNIGPWNKELKNNWKSSSSEVKFLSWLLKFRGWESRKTEWVTD